MKFQLKQADNGEITRPILKFFNYFNSLDSHRFRKAGFSLTEVLVTFGILSILGSVVTVSYLKYLERSRLKSLELFIRDFMKAGEVCATAGGGDDLTGCKTADALKFSCKDCSSVKHVSYGFGGPGSPEFISIMKTSGNCSVCVEYGYSDSYLKPTIKCRDQKFCGNSLTVNQIWNPVTKQYDNKSITYKWADLPFTKCDSKANCPDPVKQNCSTWNGQQISAGYCD